MTVSGADGKSRATDLMASIPSVIPFPRRRLAVLAVLCLLTPLYLTSFLKAQGSYCGLVWMLPYESHMPDDWFYIYMPMEALTPSLMAWVACLLSGLLALAGGIDRMRGRIGVLVSVIIAFGGLWIGFQLYKFYAGWWGDHQPWLALGLTLLIYCYLVFLFWAETGVKRALVAILVAVSLNIGLFSLTLHSELLRKKPWIFLHAVIPAGAAAMVISCLFPYWRRWRAQRAMKKAAWAESMPRRPR